MIDVEEFGIHEGISEVVLTTISPEGVSNAAPIGLHMKKGKLFAGLYNSRTLDNISANPMAAANIVDDPVLFVQSALSDIEPERFESEEGFPIIKDSLGWIIFKCRYKKGKNISVIELSPLTGKIAYRKIQPVNRGFNAVIEACIHATRYVVFKEREFLERIKYYDIIVQKCGGQREKAAMRQLHSLIKS